MNNIKAIVLDIDGTLLNHEGRLADKTKQVLIEAQQQGKRLVLASGRPTYGMIDYAKELRMDEYNGLIISYNGAQCTEFSTKKTVFNQPLSLEQNNLVLRHLEKFEVMPMIVKDDLMYVHDAYADKIDVFGSKRNVIKHEARSNFLKVCEVNNLAAFADFPLNKILVAGEPTYLQAHHTEIMKPFGTSLHGVFSAPMYFEITQNGIDKANALREVLPMYGLSKEDIISFGDGHNDATMVQYARIGVAMGNAVAALKETADYITLTNENDGVAHFIREHLLHS